MTDVHSTRPAWQTEELEDEWVEPDSGFEISHGTRSISLTAPLAMHIRTMSHESDTPHTHSKLPEGNGGTFLILEDLPAPIAPQTPGKYKKAHIKDFFSPLPLERMFEPPSPPVAAQKSHDTRSAVPVVTSGLSQEHEPHPSQTRRVTTTDLRKASMECQFTFSIPRDSPTSFHPPESFAQAQSTPGHSATLRSAPMPDPRLRLFQFQYDTFTREHLSAIVDSIALNTPSVGSGTPSTPSFGHALSKVTEALDTDTSNLRSAKRLKLSPISDYYGEGAGAGASIARPRTSRKDYVGESQNLMQQIKQARDFSTISTVASANTTALRGHESNPPHTNHLGQTPDEPHSHLHIPRSDEPLMSGGTSTSGSSRGSYSSLGYRQQAADLMAQIKHDMHTSKRVFSGDTEVSQLSRRGDKRRSRPSSPERKIQRSLVADKENHRAPQATRSSVKPPSTSFASSRPRASPQKLRRPPSTTDDVDHELADKVPSMTIGDTFPQPEVITVAAMPHVPSISVTHIPNVNNGLLAPSTGLPPPYPSWSLRSGTNGDLNRFVSSSTASGTTLTTGSAPSFVKHAGPAQIRHIAPEDVPVLPDRVGKMIFDKVMMKWVKATAMATAGIVQEDTRGLDGGTEESDDPFRDIESLREDDSRGRRSDAEIEEVDAQDVIEGLMSVIDEAEEHTGIGDEELDPTSFSFDDPSAGVVQVMTGVETEVMGGFDETTDSDDEVGPAFGTVTDESHLESAFDTDDDLNTEPLPTTLPLPAVAVPPDGGSTPLPTHRVSSTPIRPALKSVSATPVSALKDPSRYNHRTPTTRGHRRSVSFSDGKRDGPIRGLQRNADGEEGDAKQTPVNSESLFVPSVRSKRIAAMMEAEEDTELDDDSPSKTYSSTRPSQQLPSLASRRPKDVTNTVTSSPKGHNSRRVLSRSQTRKPFGSANAEGANKTFLTECSFGVAHDRLVEVITDVQPFEPHWENLNSIDLSRKNIESVARLKEFLPRLDSLNLNSNQLSWLSGVPGGVRTLFVASNFLTGITSFSHLLQLEHLDICSNNIESLRQLECLRLRELQADDNKIDSIDGLQRMEGLVSLSLQRNCISSVTFTQCRWPRIEMLNFNQNRIQRVVGLSSLSSLIVFNVDNNTLESLETNESMPTLRILRVSGNRFQQLNVAPFPNVRTLYADNNALASLIKAERLIKLENLSLRNQSGRGFNLLTRDIRDVKRLYLSGNPLKARILEDPCYNLVYLELAACRLASLPADLVALVPNLRVLNLNYNFLEDAQPLAGLKRLRKLTIIGSRLKGMKPLIRLLQHMPDMEMLDFRMNPCTLGWYLPLLVKDLPGALQPSEGVGGGADARRGESETGYSWQELDAKFRRDLPDKAYIGRLAYRGLIMRACPGIQMLDGVEVTKKERVKAQRLLVGILKKSSG